jgi:hypothetical protein
MRDIAKIIVHLEAVGIDYRFNGRRLETDGAVLYCDDEGMVINAKRKPSNKYDPQSLIGGDARMRK